VLAAVQRADALRCVLKISRELDETRTGIAALTLSDGRGAVRLLASDPDLGALLLERIEPGTMLAELAAEDDNAATRVAAGVLRELWRPATESDGLRSLESWCAAFDRNRSALQAGVDEFPRALFERADTLRADLLASTRAAVALHGDLHHFNVLRSDRAGWLAIDPKGLAGDRCFDVCQFLRNPKRSRWKSTGVASTSSARSSTWTRGARATGAWCTPSSMHAGRSKTANPSPTEWRTRSKRCCTDRLLVPSRRSAGADAAPRRAGSRRVRDVDDRLDLTRHAFEADVRLLLITSDPVKGGILSPQLAKEAHTERLVRRDWLLINHP
jgi:streptomycin 6-kinase